MEGGLSSYQVLELPPGFLLSAPWDSIDFAAGALQPGQRTTSRPLCVSPEEVLGGLGQLQIVSYLTRASLSRHSQFRVRRASGLHFRRLKPISEAPRKGSVWPRIRVVCSYRNV